MRSAMLLAGGVAVGMLLAPTPTVLQTTLVETVEPDVDVTFACYQAREHARWEGPLEDDDRARADCTFELLRALGWDITFTNIAVASDYSDAMYGGPCGGLAALLESGSW